MTITPRPPEGWQRPTGPDFDYSNAETSTTELNDSGRVSADQEATDPGFSHLNVEAASANFTDSSQKRKGPDFNYPETWTPTASFSDSACRSTASNFNYPETWTPTANFSSTAQNPNGPDFEYDEQPQNYPPKSPTEPLTKTYPTNNIPAKKPSGNLTWGVIITSFLVALAVFVTNPIVLASLQQLWNRTPSQSGVPTNPAPTKQPTSQKPTNGNNSTAPKSSKLSKGVVLIDTKTTDGAAAGTGMVIDPTGLVLTNYHVVASSTTINVTIADSGTKFTATVLGHDATKDVALLQLKGASDLNTVTLDQDGVAVGDPVTAVGNANGQGYLSSASGQVLKLSTTVETTSGANPNKSSTLTGALETTANAVSGDSGGPMLDREGEVIGITTAGKTTNNNPGISQTISYAVPIKTAMSVADQIRSGRESGTVKIGPKAWLGVSVQTALADPRSSRTQPGANANSGILVTSVSEGGPAIKAGMRAGSTLKAINDTQLRGVSDLSDLLAGLDPGNEVTISWTDNTGKTHNAKVILGASPVN